MTAETQQMIAINKLKTKTMKIIYLLLLLAGFTATAQTNVVVNALTESTFGAIQIDGHSINQIKASHGQESQIINMFGQPDETIITNSSKSRSFDYQGFEIGFSSFISNTNTPILSSFEITNPNITVTVTGVSFSVGDNISTLSTLNLNENTGGNYSNGVKGFLFAPCSRCDETFYIDYNILTQKIIKIGYFEPT